MATNGINECDLDTVEVKSNIPPKFKVEKDTKYRIGYPLLNANGRVKIKAVDFFSYEPEPDKYASWVATGDPEVDAKAKAKGAELKTRYVTAVVVYRTNKAGQPLNPLTWEVIAVVMDSRKLASLKEINAEWDLATVDVSVTTDNPQYQYHSYTPLKTAIWRLKDGDPTLAKLGLTKSIEAEVIAAAKELDESLSDAVAFTKTPQQVLEILGEAKSEAPKQDEVAANIDQEFADVDVADI
nr:MAG TPA: hypothetical protein [Bacteriophage sp.]